jgi:NTP pyrophosphatase (non-canonical NTP hydrolase)
MRIKIHDNIKKIINHIGVKMDKNKLVLKGNPVLTDYQDYIKKMVVERGFDQESIPEKFMLLLEECGEMAKAARKTQKIHTDQSSKQFELAHEAADVFVYLLDICNYFNIDLEKAFRDKEAINSQRSWQ